ncbi:hypothetical protein SAICODRAFT_21136 [Saitoella complicata NRRL Y-17804]|nr:uncharacterized protein SAICODRAFT_21136 [Saitoella complicata NRRL Y-17804]ODQ51107.1 hypothetical protein SAICODRAFT_21136 [Saitoella complicata NRRL Y-17804]
MSTTIPILENDGDRVRVHGPDEVTSHGRGGAGNFGVDTTPMIDPNVVRMEMPGAHGEAFSTGRGGTGNMGNAGSARHHVPGDPSAVTTDEFSSEQISPGLEAGEGFSTGRGGAGNVEPADNSVGVVGHGNHAHGAVGGSVDSDAVMEERREKAPEGQADAGLADKAKMMIAGLFHKNK